MLPKTLPRLATKRQFLIRFIKSTVIDTILILITVF
jgi:hypothetical protein